jgi:hypothetical protein
MASHSLSALLWFVQAAWSKTGKRYRLSLWDSLECHVSHLEQEFKKWLGNERIKVFAVASDNKIEHFKQAHAYPVRQ